MAEVVMPMDVRLAQVVSSFLGAYGQYTLARLEFAMRHPAEPAPPLVPAPHESSEPALREHWPALEMQLDRALAFAARFERSRRRRRAADRAFWSFARSVRELDRSARAIRWALTIGERTYDG